jgi:hypothetical protein
LHENKTGEACDTLEDVLYAELPNGRRLIIAAFSNGLDPRRGLPERRYVSPGGAATPRARAASGSTRRCGERVGSS